MTESFAKPRVFLCCDCCAEVSTTSRTALYCRLGARLRAQTKHQASGANPTGAAQGERLAATGAPEKKQRLNFRATIGLTQQEYEDLEIRAHVNGYRHVGAYLRAVLIAEKEIA